MGGEWPTLLRIAVSQTSRQVAHGNFRRTRCRRMNLWHTDGSQVLGLA
jgi:hypothetical protein